MNIVERLKAMQEAWEEAKVREGFNRELPPDGTYQMRVDGARLVELGDSGLFLRTELVVLSPDKYEGWEVETLHGLEDKQRLDVTKRHLMNMGVTVLHLAEIEHSMLDALDAVVEAEVKTSTKLDRDGKPYRNVYVNKLIASGVKKSDIPSDGAVPATDERIPF